MNIGIDIDDVITNGESYYLYSQKYIIEELKQQPTIVNDLGTCDNSAYCDELFGWTDEIGIDFWEKNMKNVISEAVPRMFAAEIISKLRKEGNKIFLITARTDAEMKYGYDWLKKYNIEYDEICYNLDEKGQIAKEKNIDIFLDDSFCHCKDVAAQGIKSYIMDTRTNRNIKLDGTSVKRIFSWLHFYEEVRKENK